MSSIFGGSKQSSTSTQKSWNEAYPFLQETYGDQAGNNAKYGDAIASLLGLNGDASVQEAAFDRFKDSSGYQFKMDEGQRAITTSNAAKGLLQSGSTLKSLARFGTGLADSTFNSYMDQLTGQQQMGLAIGQLLAGAGQRSEGQSQSTGKQKPGLGGFIGSIAGGIAKSDRRLKTNIKRVSKLDDGLPVYQYKMIDGSGPYIGVMADEVAKFRPEALGPIVDGYSTVNYGKIW